MLAIVMVLAGGRTTAENRAGDVLSGWTSYSPFELGSRAMKCAQLRTSGIWWVSTSEGELRISSTMRQKTLRTLTSRVRPEYFGLNSPFVVDELKVSPGRLVALNAGEWGGGVWWYSDDDAQHYLVSLGNPMGVEPYQDKIVMISGLTHLSASIGFVGILEKDAEERWVLSRRIDLPAAAEAFIREDDTGTLLIATPLGLTRVRGSEASKLTTSNFSRMYINSIAKDRDGDIFLGMTHIIVRFRQDADGGLTEEWLTPPGCSSTIEQDTDRCVCSDGKYDLEDIRFMEDTEPIEWSIPAMIVVTLVAAALTILIVRIARAGAS